MIYDTVTKGEDGLYHVRAFTDERKKVFVQLNNVKIVDVSEDLAFEPADFTNVDAVHDLNIQNAVENGEIWFGRKVTDKTIKSAYIRDDTISAERIGNTKVFNADKEVVDFETIEVGSECSVIVEFSGLWFAKKAFGPAWNIVQVKINRPNEPEPEPEKFDETYPDDYMFEDDQ